MRFRSIKCISRLKSFLTKKLYNGSSGMVFKGMATLMLGSGAGKLIGLMAIPILTRIYSPIEFGALAVFTGFILIFSPILTLRYVLALPLVKNDGLAFNALMLSLMLMVGILFIISIVLWAFSESILNILSMQILVPWWWLIPIGLLATALHELLSLWALRNRNYKIIARTRVWQSFAGTAVKILLGVLTINKLGLLIGQIVAQGGGINTLLYNYRKDFSDNWRHLRKSRIKKLIYRYRDFPIFRVPSNLLTNISVQSPLFLSAFMFDASTTGQLGLALMALALPSQLIAQTANKAYYAEISHIGHQHPEKIKLLAINVTKKLILIGFIPVAFLFILAPTFFTVIFGEEWLLSGQFARYLAIYLMMQFVFISIMNTLTVFNKEKSLLGLSFLRLVIVVLVFLIGYLLEISSLQLVLAYSVLMAMYFLIAIYVVLISIN